MIKSSDFAWAVGVFEGEGYIAKLKGRSQWRLGLEMADEDIVLRVSKAFGCGRMKRPRQRQEHYKVMFIWHCGRADEARSLLENMLPLLGKRRAATAKIAIAELQSVKYHAPVALHGTLSRYTSRKWKCRCDRCKRAWRKYKVLYDANRKARLD